MKYLIMIILSLSVIAFTGVGIAVVLYSKDPLLNRLVDMGMIGMCAVVCAGFLWFWLRWIGASSGPYRRDKKSNRRRGMTVIKLKPESPDTLLAAIDRAEKDADRIEVCL